MRLDMEAATTDQILPMVQHELGIGFLPADFAKEALQAGEVFQIQLKEEIPERCICLVTDTERAPSVAARALMQELVREGSF
jgi:DNA-binding transcriptional LysR family regulator